MIYRDMNIAVFWIEHNGNRKYIADAVSFGSAERIARHELRSNGEEGDRYVIAITDEDRIIKQEVETVTWRRDEFGVLSYFIEEV